MSPRGRRPHGAEAKPGESSVSIDTRLRLTPIGALTPVELGERRAAADKSTRMHRA